MSDELFELRFFFDAGTGTCLWSASEAARRRFNYPVALDSLPLPEATRRYGSFLCAWYDTPLDWAYPPAPSPWSLDEARRFAAAVPRFLAVLRSELGPQFVIHDETTSDLNFVLADRPGALWR